MFAGITVELDGVLVDSSARRSQSLAAAFAAAGAPITVAPTTIDPSAEFDHLVADCIAAYSAARIATHSAEPSLIGLDDTARALIALRAEREDRARVAAGVTLIDGAREAIAALATECRTAVVSAWPRADAERVVALAGLDGIVRFIVAADDGPRFASASVRYTRALARLRRARTAGPVAAVAALVAGPRGAAAAQAAGAYAVLVGVDVLIADLTIARLAAAVDAPGSSATPPVTTPPSRP